MERFLDDEVTDVFILGAGASADYGLPLWRDLAILIKEKAEASTTLSYKNKNEIIDWVDKTGEGKKYRTIDECIYEESVSEVYRDNGADIEEEVFYIIKEIFEEKYVPPAVDKVEWISKLSESILQKPELKDKLAFVNYNYDDVLDKNLLNFSNLKAKHKRWTYTPNLERVANAKLDCFYPNGYFATSVESSHLEKYTETIKSHDKESSGVVSCYDSKKLILNSSYSYNKIKLYILGLGGGLETNLGHLILRKKIGEIHITIKDGKDKEKIVQFLVDKFEVPEEGIKIYNDCRELANKCF